MIEKNFIVWHDVINNSLSKHRSNNDNPLTPESLIKILKEYKTNYQPLFTYTVKIPLIFMDVWLKQE